MSQTCETLVWWDLTTFDDQEYRVTDAQMQAIQRASAEGNKLVKISQNDIINPSSIKKSKRVVIERDQISVESLPLSAEEKRFLVNSPKQLKGGDQNANLLD